MYLLHFKQFMIHDFFSFAIQTLKSGSYGMDYNNLVSEINKKQSFLCVGLDTDLSKIPSHLLDFEDPVFEFNKQVIDATKDYCVAYKPNIAFYEAMGIKGWESLKKTIDYIPKNIFTIADAKRGDIGNTAKKYAETFYETYDFDSITVAPYMGEDSITPFLEYEDKWTILLGVTSNKGGSDFQLFGNEHGKPLYQEVLERSMKWGTKEQLMFVVGATRGTLIEEVRAIAKENFFLVPGVGAQGGSLEEVVKYGRTKDVGLLVNSSRGIIYAGKGIDFSDQVKEAAFNLQQEMAAYL